MVTSLCLPQSTRAIQFWPTASARCKADSLFLDGVAGSSSLNQADGIHPTGEGYHLIVERIFPVIEPLLERIR
jgi:lysophospholipase L1-like esterase